MGKDQQKSNDKKQRPEHLSTTIGDLLKVQGNDILKTKKKPYKKNNNKKHKNFKERTKNKNILIENKKPEPKVNESLKAAIDKAVEEGILRADDATNFDLRTPEQIEADKYKDGVIIKDGSMEEFAAAFLAEPEKEQPKMDDGKQVDKIVIGAEYITKNGTDRRVKTDEFVSN